MLRLAYLWNRHVEMPFWWWFDLWCVRRYERAFLRASRAERRLKGN